MSGPRLTAEFWVQAYLARLRLADIPAFVTARGDATAGAVAVKLNTLDGQARAFGRAWDARLRGEEPGYSGQRHSGHPADWSQRTRSERHGKSPASPLLKVLTGRPALDS